MESRAGRAACLIAAWACVILVIGGLWRVFTVSVAGSDVPSENTSTWWQDMITGSIFFSLVAWGLFTAGRDPAKKNAVSPVQPSPVLPPSPAPEQQAASMSDVDAEIAELEAQVARQEKLNRIRELQATLAALKNAHR